jgi:predicted kinase
MEPTRPILFILSGLPATGKSTLSKFISKRYSAIYLRIDTLEQGLTDLCGIDAQGEGYGLAYKIAADNLKLGLSVVADSCNPIQITREEWEKIAESNSCIYINIEVICSDKNEHKTRAESRTSEIDNLKMPTWTQIVNREYDKWIRDRIIIDTAHKSIEDSASELILKIEHSLRTQMATS